MSEGTEPSCLVHISSGNGAEAALLDAGMTPTAKKNQCSEWWVHRGSPVQSESRATSLAHNTT